MNNLTESEHQELRENFAYIAAKGLDNEFTKSLRTQYELKNYLTDKQANVLNDKVFSHKKAHTLLKYCIPEFYLLDSFKEQFNTRKFLSPKQMKMLEKWVHKPDSPWEKPSDEIWLGYLRE